MIQENMIFALDIGTHSVVGILGTAEGGGFSVLDYEQYFHRPGAMRDGQIEDISLVSEGVRTVKTALENRSGVTLTAVSIAAAGRSLITAQASYEQEVPRKPLTAEEIRALEYGALSAAMDSLTEKKQQTDAFSCVGYSVTSYFLDDYRYRNLEGHQGDRAKVDLIAAFLPVSVIRSLYTVTERCGLSVDSLTLEPIAAIEAVVPQDIRLLNLALVDIGAGTSDIALSKNGSIVAYDMVTVAGDEITESIMQRFLVDFETAEGLKRSLSRQYDTTMGESVPPIPYVNILGFSEHCTTEEILAAATPSAEALCTAIAQSIQKLNQENPVAVFLVGGGSRFPTLCTRMAEALGLPPERVALGGTKEYKTIRLSSDALLSPEFVTPLGILVNSPASKTRDFFSITVNGQKVMLWETGNLKVLDALLLAGIKATQLIGHTPAPLAFTVNGVKRTVRGTPAAPGQLSLNGAAASLDSPVRQGDTIDVTFACDGRPPQVSAAQLLQELGEPGFCRINGEQVSPDRLIAYGDAVELLPEPAPQSHRLFHLCLNGQWMDIAADGETGLLQFAQLFNYVNLDTANPKGDIILTLNGTDAAFTDILKDEDVAEIRWSEE